jgi:hypothetical protein
MPFPQTLKEMTEASYQFQDHAVCRGCGDDIEWWQTPNGKKIPMNPVNASDDKAVSHWATCSDAPSFRK